MNDVVTATHLSALSIKTLAGVGPRMLENLQRLGISTVQDLLFHLPLRYEDRTRITPICELTPGDHAVIEGKVLGTAIVGQRRKSLVCKLHDGSGMITLRFFHFNAYQKQQLTAQDCELRCFGEVRQGYNSGLEMTHPEYRIKDKADELALSDQLTPIYPTTKGLQQATLRKLTAQALSLLQIQPQVELLPNQILQQYKMHSLVEALLYVHRPPQDANVDILKEGKHPAQQRLAFEELIAHQLGLQQLRKEIKTQPAPVLATTNKLSKQLMEALPFKLTNAQQHVITEINQDLNSSAPMLRLVQGDVGSGKTIVAAMAVLQAIAQGYQAAVMVPTEILVDQHLRNFTQWLEPLGIKVGWLSGRSIGKSRLDAIKKIAEGEYAVVIGTHALFQAGVEFKNLALLVVDEQHRFGVHQRLALKEKGNINGMTPHQLIMTATPIPRTLAMTAYADLDCSVIDELPPGRKPIQTVLISNDRRDEIITRAEHHCHSGTQAYWICTLIEDSEVLQCQAAEATAKELQIKLPKLKIGLVHGRQKAEEKEMVMQQFKNAEINLLVATTVVEVGVDVPNASLMIIENPERLGLAQLHQLRGRVGRGEIESHCVLLYQNPLSQAAKQRLTVMRQTQDGFLIAKEDLEMRGPGEVLGTRQAGLMRFKIADLMRDQILLPNVHICARMIVQDFPEQVSLIIERWLNDADRYARV